MSQKYVNRQTMSRRPDPRNERTRTAIKAALVGLLSDRPMDQVLVRDIVHSAGIGNATFFRHYRDKAQVLEEVVQDFFDQASAAMFSALVERHSDLGARHICQFVDQHRKVYAALLSSSASSQIREAFVERTVDRALPMLAGRPTRVPGRLAATYPLTAILAILAWWLSDAPDTPSDEIAELIERLVLKPLVDY
jgi:AcrR family transcriptional regulator